MALYKVVVQKSVIGKSKPKEADLVRNRRVLIVEARDAVSAERFVQASRWAGPVVFTQLVGDRIVVLGS